MTEKQTTQQVEVHTGNGQLAGAPRRVVTPPADVLRRKDRLVLTLDMPGVEPASLEVTFSEGILKVLGKTRPAENEASGGVTYAEFEFGDYERSFRVDERIDTAAIAAELVDGALRIELPLEKPAQTRVAVRTS